LECGAHGFLCAINIVLENDSGSVLAAAEILLCERRVRRKRLLWITTQLGGFGEKPHP
jgi:hypothetical protein